MNLVRCVLFALTLGYCHGFFMSGRQPEWNGLRVTYGVNFFNSLNFQSVPRTESAALEDGFIKISDCQSSSKFVGKRYWKNEDAALILIYDDNGYIAGIQAGVPNNLRNGYPTSNLIPHPYIADGDKYFVTAYFVDPATICTGRTLQDFKTHGTGTDLYIQNGSDPIADSFMVPKSESDHEGSLWTRSKCLYTMGQHYYYNLDEYMDCDKLFPVFLLYNDGKLNSFGWAFKADLPSPRLEHPPKSIYTTFVDPVPRCLYREDRLSTMHIYLTNSPYFNRC